MDRFRGGGTAKFSEEKYISPESTKSFISKASGIKGNNVMEDNIPKIIHYFWFGGNPMPPLAEKCIASWKQYLPDYKIKRWDESNFDVNCIDYVAEAYKAKKYAFVSDYARLLILYKYGGLYFDTDVEVIHNMYDIVANGPFFAIENQILHLVKISPGLVMGAYKEMPFLKDVVDSYNKDHFLLPDGNYNLTTINDRVTKMLSELGWNAEDRTQRVGDFTIYSSEYFCPLHARTDRIHITENSKAIHWYAGSWVDKSKWNLKLLKRIAKHLVPEKVLGWWLERQVK